MKTRWVLSPIILSVYLTGCAGFSPTRIATDTLGAGGGAAIANQLSHGNPLVTAAGAGAGVLLSETVNGVSENTAKKAYANGYDKGRSDAVKQQYWAAINQQKAAEGAEAGENTTLYQIPLPEQRIDGAILKPTTRTLRIQE